MQFTEADKKLLATVRHRRQIWLRLRWIMLIISSAGMIISLVVFIFCYLAAIAVLSEPDLKTTVKTVAVLAMGASVCSAFLLSFAALLGSVIGRWKSPTMDLLLRLAEE